MEAAVAPLPIVAARGRPVATAETRLMELPGALADLFPEGGIRRGSTVAVGSADPAGGAASLALALAAPATGGGGWAAAVGAPALGLVAAAEMGVRLERLALVPYPGDQWPVVTAALIDGMDLLIVVPPARVRLADARRLVARARERGAVLLVLDPGVRSRSWPEPPDVRLTVAGGAWDGLGVGYGSLRSRRVEVIVTGRRAAARERRRWLWLPDPGGEMSAGSRAQVGEPAAALVG